MKHIYFRTLSDTAKATILRATKGENEKVTALKETLSDMLQAGEGYEALSKLAEEIQEGVSGIPDEDLEEIIRVLESENYG